MRVVRCSHEQSVSIRRGEEPTSRKSRYYGAASEVVVCQQKKPGKQHKETGAQLLHQEIPRVHTPRPNGEPDSRACSEITEN